MTFTYDFLNTKYNADLYHDLKQRSLGWPDLATFRYQWLEKCINLFYEGIVQTQLSFKTCKTFLNFELVTLEFQ